MIYHTFSISFRPLFSHFSSTWTPLMSIDSNKLWTIATMPTLLQANHGHWKLSICPCSGLAHKVLCVRLSSALTAAWWFDYRSAKFTCQWRCAVCGRNVMSVPWCYSRQLRWRLCVNQTAGKWPGTRIVLCLRCWWSEYPTPQKNTRETRSATELTLSHPYCFIQAATHDMVFVKLEACNWPSMPRESSMSLPSAH